MTDTWGRRETAEGDAARAWHCLDGVLQSLYGVRDALEEGGFEERAGELQTVADALEKAYAEAERKLTRALEGSD